MIDMSISFYMLHGLEIFIDFRQMFNIAVKIWKGKVGSFRGKIYNVEVISEKACFTHKLNMNIHLVWRLLF